MREWEGRCTLCRRKWRLQLEPNSEDLTRSIVTVVCPGGCGCGVMLSEMRSNA